MPRSRRHGDHLPRHRAAATAPGRIRLQAVRLQLCRHGQVLRRLASIRLWLRAGDTALWLIVIVHCLSFLVYVLHQYQVLRKRDRLCHSGGRPALVDRCDELHNGGVLTARRAAPRLWGGSAASTGVSRAPRSCHQDQLLIKSERALREGGEEERAKADSEIIDAAKLAKKHHATMFCGRLGGCGRPIKDLHIVLRTLPILAARALLSRLRRGRWWQAPDTR